MRRKWIWWGLLVLLLGACAVGAYAYQTAFKPNVRKDLGENVGIKIPRGVGFDYVVAELDRIHALEDLGTFKRVAEFRGYPKLVKAGYYKLKPGMSTWDLVNKLRSGAQDEMKLIFRSHRALEEIADDIGDQMDFGKEALLEKLRDAEYLKKYEFTPTSVRGLLVPNTYRVYWTMTVDEFFTKMKQEYDSFWNADRKGKAEKLGLTPAEVITLASIVQAETSKDDERPTVAGLYLNRIRDGIPLQADPTVIFAHQDWSIRRVLLSHLEIDSPYNTYKNLGLPPGPINNPEPSAIEAVLSPASHNYYFMCAKEDFSGYHRFARTNAEHEKNAAKYRNALNKRGVYR